MKTFFIHATADEDVRLTPEAIQQLPPRIGLVTNVQHLAKLQDIHQQLPQSKICGQILGCRADPAERAVQDVDAFLFIGGGVFHPIFVAVKTGKPVYCWNPADKLLTTITQEQVNDYQNTVERQLKLFYNAKKVGILVTTKIGQNENKINTPSQALKMQMPLNFSKRADKEYYLFACDTLQISELENFPFIDCWVNTACSRIADEKNSVVNMEDILEFEKKHDITPAQRTLS